MARVYLDTSFISACVTTRTDVHSAARRETSDEWMKSQGARHDLFISAEVLDELAQPAHRSADAALAIARGLELLPLTDEVFGVAEILVRELVLPKPARGDALHVAVCCLYRIDYLLSWNVRHLANPNKIRHLENIMAKYRLLPPQIVTPDLLWETA